MNTEKCAAPNCYNTATTGIPFPKEPEILEKWLNSLKIPEFLPTDHCFVCLDHFGSNSLLDNTNSALENCLEELPVPVQTCNQVKNENGQIMENLVFLSSCRLCMGSIQDKDEHVNIFDKFDENINVRKAINQCIPALKIIKTDCLSKLICAECFNLIKLFYNFKNTCIQADIKQRKMLPTEKRKSRDSNNHESKKICLNMEKKFERVEAELMKALEGKLTDEMKSADNIIIEVQSDDENADSNAFTVDAQLIKIPKGIHINPCQPKVCNNSEIIKTDIGNFEFCLVDHYLFDFRLRKGNIVQMKCLNTKCKSTAIRNIALDEIIIHVNHNHPPPNKDETKKQTFLHLMRRKMQSDKTLNFRNVYEDFCAIDPDLKRIIPLKAVINQVCCQQMSVKSPQINSFDEFYNLIEDDQFQKLHFTNSFVQFYQEKLEGEDGAKAVIFANRDTINEISGSKLMYVDSSFKIDTKEPFQYHLVSTLVWITDSYYPIMFALVNERSQEIYKAIFKYLHDSLAPKLRPDEIVTDYQAALYYALGETYLDSHIGGSVFYYTQNLYKKICCLNQSRELETNSCFRNIYHMILMLPLLPVNTIADGLNNIELQANEMGQSDLTKPLFDYVKTQWMEQVTPDLFCVHRLENRINENVIAPFKKLRDFLMLSKGKMQKTEITISSVIEKLIELESFLQGVYSAPSKKSFARDLSSSQKKNVIRAWQFIESHPKININNFFTKVLGYIKCMENQLWIWGFYRYTEEDNDYLINAANFSIVNEQDIDHNYERNLDHYEQVVVTDVVIEQRDVFLVKESALLL